MKIRENHENVNDIDKTGRYLYDSNVNAPENGQLQTIENEDGSGRNEKNIMESIQEAVAEEKSKGVTGSTLKMIAIIAMLIDHTGAIVIERILMRGITGMDQLLDIERIQANAGIYILDGILRLIGRLGFPIFCFLLVEGFGHTRNVKKYAGRLFLFALISEVPFDLGFNGKLVYMGYQNVFFTLLIGLLVMMGMHFLEEKKEWNKIVRILCEIAVVMAGMAAAQLLRTDYKAFGVLTIVVMYLFRKNKLWESGLGCLTLTIMSLVEITSFFVMIPIHKYNGQRGWNMKWLFYAFYPVHILVLYLIACGLGL